LNNDTELCLRIYKIRKTLGYTQQKFAEGLKISKAHVGAMELNNRKVPERIVKMICFTYGVNEKWLKTGKGDMFEKGRDYKLEEVIDIFNRLDELLQDYVLKQIRLALEFQEKEKDGK
jgi:transcriptional regulator with XRE-family HTH domain